MQVVLALMVAVELVGLAIQFELSLADAVGKSSRNLAGTGAVKEIVLQFFVTQHHVGQFAVTVGNLDLQDACAQ